MAFPSTSVLDNFNRANEGPPMTGWTAWLSTGLKVLSNQCAPNDSGDNAAYYSTAMGGPDVEAYLTIATLPQAGGATALAARVDPAGGGSSGDGYWVGHDVSAGTDTMTIQRVDNGVGTTIGGPWNQDLSAGDGIGIRCVGSTIEAWARVSGVWAIVGAVSDATYPGTGSQNKLGVYNYGGGGGSTIARYDDFGGGVVASYDPFPYVGAGYFPTEG